MKIRTRALAAAGRARRLWPLAVILLLLPAAFPAPAEGAADIATLRRSVQVLQRIRQRIGAERAGQGEPGQQAAEERETGVFLAFLLGRIREDCRRLLAAGGRQAVAGLSCPAGGAALPGQAGEVARTSDEEVGLLDRQLASELGEFDEMLLREEERLAARVPRRRESGGGTGGARAGTGDGGPGSGMAAAGDAGRAGQRDSTGTTESGTEGAQGTGEKSGGPAGGATGRDSATAAGSAGAADDGVAGTAPAGGRPRDVDAMAADDDIVARQLREAAEKETDPVLKEKLWQEYRRYKQGR